MVKNFRLYKGIEYVQLSELPTDQRDLIAQSPNRDLIIKILVDGKILDDCIQFKDYEAWYGQHFNVGSSRLISNVQDVLSAANHKPSALVVEKV